MWRQIPQELVFTSFLVFIKLQSINILPCNAGLMLHLLAWKSNRHQDHQNSRMMNLVLQIQKKSFLHGLLAVMR